MPFKFYFDCRATGKGAYTSAGGREFNHSRTGNHWQEVVEAEPGEVIRLIDITNSGKHNCRIFQVTEEGGLKDITPETDPEICPVCDGEEL